MEVIKRNGQSAEFNPNKILNRIKKSADGLEINTDELFIKVTQGIYDKITSAELDELIANTSISYITDNPQYSMFASNILISRLHKEIPLNLLKVSKTLYKKNKLNKTYYKKVLEWGEEFEKVIDYSKDFDFDYFAIGRLKAVYLLKEEIKKEKKIVHLETPQQMFARVAINRSKTLEDAIEDYRQINSTVSPATPILLNSGTPSNQLASCELHFLNDDSKEGIAETYKRLINASANSAGIGLAISNLRSNYSELSTGGNAAGIVPFAKVVNDLMRQFDQGGKRPGSCAMYLEPWHREIYEFLNLRKPQGEDSLRARDLFLALWVPDLFMEKVRSDDVWYLFCPDEILKAGLKPFYEIYGKEFEKEYYKAIELGLGKKIRAKNLWIKICEVLIETGMPYIQYKDHVNRKTNHKNIGTIKSSNLCSEVEQYTDSQSEAICTLTTFILKEYVKNGVFDFEHLSKDVAFQVKQLNNVIDINGYSNPSGKKGGQEQRAMGLGMLGLADAFLLMNYPSFVSLESKKLNKHITETIYYSALRASNELSKDLIKKYCNEEDIDFDTFKILEQENSIIEKFTYKYFKGSPYSNGILQYDMWDKTEYVESNSRYDWKALKESIKQYGLRNSLLTCIVPTASTSNIRNCAEMAQPFDYNISKRKVKEKEYIVVNKHMIEKLIENGWWNDWMKKQIMLNEGSVQSITALPIEFREQYKTIWEIKQSDLIDMMLDRAIFIDQGQSMNIFMKEPTVSKITSCMFYSWEKGSKHGSYYLHTKPISTGAKDLALDMSDDYEGTEVQQSNGDFECFGCSS
jgi:ribonucleoside-diphosphate reductase alpha chain